jgi:hypothetical protein
MEYKVAKMSIEFMSLLQFGDKVEYMGTNKHSGMEIVELSETWEMAMWWLIAACARRHDRGFGIAC